MVTSDLMTLPSGAFFQVVKPMWGRSESARHRWFLLLFVWLQHSALCFVPSWRKLGFLRSLCCNRNCTRSRCPLSSDSNDVRLYVFHVCGRANHRSNQPRIHFSLSGVRHPVRNLWWGIHVEVFYNFTSDWNTTTNRHASKLKGTKKCNCKKWEI